MKTLLLTGAFVLGLATVRPAEAQRVSGSIVVVSGPVAAHIVVNPYPHRHYYAPRPVVIYRRPAPRVVVVQRYAPRVIVVHRYRWGRPIQYWHGRGYRRIVVWYDPYGHRYYDRYYAGRGVREVVVWQKGGNIYHDDDYRYDRPDQVDNYREYRSDRAQEDDRYQWKDDERNDRGADDSRR